MGPKYPIVQKSSISNNMNRLLLTLLYVLCGWRTGSAQPRYKPIQFFYRPSIGAMLPTRSPSLQYISDNLVGNKFGTLFGQVIDVGFFYKNFGLETSIVLSPIRGNESQHSKFVNAVNREYANGYYTSISSSSMYDYENNSSDPIVRGSIGPAYKVERNRLVLVGRVMVGVASFDTGSGTAWLKEKGGNQLLTINWSREHPSIDCFAINPSFTVAYRVSRRIAVDLDLSTWHYRTDIDYTEKATNAVTGIVTTREYGYNQLMNDVSIGLGIMVVFK